MATACQGILEPIPCFRAGKRVQGMPGRPTPFTSDAVLGHSDLTRGHSAVTANAGTFRVVVHRAGPTKLRSNGSAGLAFLK